ncbi:hypothetical protein EI555_007256 [Monodon monoceros]|uniref:Interleukin-7 n=1 Tax=Monodon monoceros TaxID=40151 RepID=A0A4U1EH79_MONMO|nr:hypothetical protein EI555_007256 [Monodon monoceros]
MATIMVTSSRCQSVMPKLKFRQVKEFYSDILTEFYRTSGTFPTHCCLCVFEYLQPLESSELVELHAMGPSLLHGSEDTSGLHHILSTNITPFDVGGILLLEDGLSIDESFPFSALTAMELAMESYWNMKTIRQPHPSTLAHHHLHLGLLSLAGCVGEAVPDACSLSRDRALQPPSRSAVAARAQIPMLSVSLPSPALPAVNPAPNPPSPGSWSRHVASSDCDIEGKDGGAYQNVLMVNINDLHTFTNIRSDVQVSKDAASVLYIKWHKKMGLCFLVFVPLSSLAEDFAHWPVDSMIDFDSNCLNNEPNFFKKHSCDDNKEASFLYRAARKLKQFLKMNISDDFNLHLSTVSQGTLTLLNCTNKEENKSLKEQKKQNDLCFLKILLQKIKTCWNKILRGAKEH